MEAGNYLKEGALIDFKQLGSLPDDNVWIQRQLNLFWAENPVFHLLVQKNADLETIRKWVFNYLADFERKTLNNQAYVDMLDRNIARKCIHTLKNVFSKRSEDVTGYSILSDLISLAHHFNVTVSLAFVEELRRLFIGMKGNTGLAANRRIVDYNVVSVEDHEINSSRMTAQVRSTVLNGVSGRMQEKMASYRSGLEDDVILRRAANRNRMLKVFGATTDDWFDWSWQCKHIVRDIDTLERLIQLTPAEREAVVKATGNRLPFGITPYYLSLMDLDPGRRLDHAVRAQVIPPPDYVDKVVASQASGIDLDFMGEKETSPVDLITRRYPMVAIFKPYNTCAQICVYCQRNWEITDVLAENARATKNKLEMALDWLEENIDLDEVLITGGDPAVMSDRVMAKILKRIAGMSHIRRIRIGTRIPVVLPMRITEEYASLLASFSEPGRREVAVMTHFEHPYEVTPESMEAVQRLKTKGISVYNQTVFTMENARKFEMVSLRIVLRQIGVDPYYTFNAKGKEETKAYRVPIARLIQEQVEEARLTPGLDRTDEAVFNIPRLGKSYLRAGQDHEVIMLMPSGARVYEFYPWDQSDTDTRPYLYEDVPVLDFLTEMVRRGEDVDDYKTVWYYF